MRLRSTPLFLLLAGSSVIFALAGCARAQDGGKVQNWTVDGVARQALIFAPASATSEPTPLLFVFHGHGGNMNGTAKYMQYQTYWPGAIVVYPQALNTPGMTSDLEGKKPGWQPRPGMEGDRDVKFFDAMLATLKQQYKVDDHRLYVAGFSSGGAFTYILWLMRGAEIRAVAPASAADATLAPLVPQLKPMPVMVISGTLEKTLDWQKAVIAALVTLDGAGPGQPWTAPDCVLYPPGKPGFAVMSLLHPDAHMFPRTASALVVKFFQQYAGGNDAPGTSELVPAGQ